MHGRLWVCLEVWGLHAWKALGLLGGGLHACVSCLQVAQKGFGLPAGLGVSCMEALGLLGGFGVCMHGRLWVCLEVLGSACMKALDWLGGFGVFMHGVSLEVLGSYAWKALGLLGGGCMRA